MPAPVRWTLEEIERRATWEPNTGCLLWLHAHLPFGYGRIGSTGYAHRVAWEIVHGPIPAGGCVLHRCDQPACVNVAHLRLGTQAENMRDMTAKRRGNRVFPGRKLSAADVAAIRADVHTPQSVLAERFGVRTQTVSAVRCGKSWRGGCAVRPSLEQQDPPQST
jgi:hypothetical protein